MQKPLIPPNEAERLRILRGLSLLDTPPEERFDRLTRLARAIMGTEIALVSLIDEARQWFKSRQGLDATETPRDISFCGHAILQDVPLVVEDATHDIRFCDNPLVVGAPHIRFYAGIPLRSQEGYRMGTLCVIDSVPHVGKDKELAMLADLAALVERELISVSLEITRRELTETQERVNAVLERSNAELQMIIDHMPAMIGYWDTELKNRFGNRAYQDWFGIAPDQLRGKHIAEVIGRERYELNLPYMQAALKGLPQMFERGVIGQDGVPHNTLASYVPDIVDGKVNGFYAFVNDVTPLRRAQEAQTKAQTQLQSIIDAASEFSIVAIDLNAVITLFSLGAQRMLGYDPDEIIGKQKLGVIHQQEELERRCARLSEKLGYRVDAFEFFSAALREGNATSGEWTYVRKDGTSVPVWVVATAIYDTDGKTVGFLAIANDISRQKQLQSSLIAAKEQAEAASRAKSEFLANMSHEIRTPMNAVLGMTYLLGTTGLSQDQKTYLEMIRASGESLRSILNDILDFSKIEAGCMELVDQNFELCDVLNALATIMTVNAEEKDLELAIGIAPDAPRRVVGDAMRLQQVLINLVGNAIKFTESGEVAILVESQVNEEGKPSLCFRVRDTGIGMTAEQQTRLFIAFSQADASTTRRFGGTGLGLTICKRIVDLMNGSIAVHSELGKGSEFSVILPLQVSDTESDVIQSAIALGKLRILVVDDNATSRDYICRTVQSLLWQADAAASGEEAIEYIRQLRAGGKKIDAVLLDWQMPGMDGLATMQAIRREFPDLYIPLFIMASAFGRGKLRQLESASQADAMLIKPLTGSTLCQALNDAFASREEKAPTGSAAFGSTVATAPAGRSRVDGARILLVEDNSLNQIVAKSLLEQAGAVVAVVEDGLQAVELLRIDAESFDLILMDVQMPVMDGFAATRIIREELGLQQPVLAMSAGVMQSEQEQCVAVGMNDFIGKPLDINQMFDAIGRHWPPPVTQNLFEDEEGIFDPVQLVQLGSDNPGFRNTVLGIVRGLVDRGMMQLAEARSAWQNGQIDDVVRRLHGMRGTFGTLGAHQFATVALELENVLLSGQYDPVPRLFESAEKKMRRTVLAAASWLEEQKVPAL